MSYRPPPIVLGGPYRTTASGLKVLDTEVGSGEEASAGRVATIEFEGSLLDGDRVLSSTKQDGKPLSFTVGAGDAPLWDEVCSLSPERSEPPKVGASASVLAPTS